MEQIRNIQRSFRLSSWLKSHICKFILMPSLWQVETEILGKAFKMPQIAIKNIIGAQERLVNLEARILEVKRITALRKELLQVRPAREGMSPDLVLPSFERQNGASRCMVTEVGKALPLRGGSGPGLRTHPMMDKVDRHRLPVDVRKRVINELFDDNVEYWCKCDSRYKAELAISQHQWEEWRFSVVAFGPHQRAKWPPVPQAPPQPVESTITFVDAPRLRRMLQGLLRPNTKEKS